MRIILVLLPLACACQRAEAFDIDVMNLTPVAVDAESAPVQPYRMVFAEVPAAPVPPPLAAIATASVGGDPRSVTVHVDLQGATAGELAIEFTMPDGAAYERKAQPTADAPFDTQRFDFALPVAGTWIESQQLYGEWRARVLFGANELSAPPFTVSP